MERDAKRLMVGRGITSKEFELTQGFDHGHHAWYLDSSNDSKLDEVKVQFSSLNKLYTSSMEAANKVKTTQYWDLSVGLTQNLGHLMDVVSSKCLESSSQPVASTSSGTSTSARPALATPMYYEVTLGTSRPTRHQDLGSGAALKDWACMFYSRSKVAPLKDTYPMGPTKRRRATNEDPRDTSVHLVLVLGYIGGKQVVENASRLVHLAFHGPPKNLDDSHPGPLQVNHSCGHRGCLNPRHTYWGTQGDNVEDGKSQRSKRESSKRRRT